MCEICTTLKSEVEHLKTALPHLLSLPIEVGLCRWAAVLCPTLHNLCTTLEVRVVQTELEGVPWSGTRWH
jgi:hypothetical protein